MEKKENKIHETINYTKGFFGGFKRFITKGNILDMAIGVVIGASFNAIITTLVNGVLLQFIALLTGNAEFGMLSWNLDSGRVNPDGTPIIVAIQYGAVIQAIVNFLIVAFTIYVIVYVIIKKSLKKQIEEEKQKALEKKEEEIPKDILLLTEIKEQLVLLNKNNSQ